MLWLCFSSCCYANNIHQDISWICFLWSASQSHSSGTLTHKCLSCHIICKGEQIFQPLYLKDSSMKLASTQDWLMLFGLSSKSVLFRFFIFFSRLSVMSSFPGSTFIDFKIICSIQNQSIQQLFNSLWAHRLGGILIEHHYGMLGKLI